MSNQVNDPQIATLEPGLELDKMIAEQVLGWHKDSLIEEWEEGRENVGHRDYWYEEDNKRLLYLEHFSTDIKEAWILAEKFSLFVFPHGNGWSATRIGRLLIDNETNEAPTAPHAICLAALFYANEEDT